MDGHGSLWRPASASCSALDGPGCIALRGSFNALHKRQNPGEPLDIESVALLFEDLSAIDPEEVVDRNERRKARHTVEGRWTSADFYGTNGHEAVQLMQVRGRFSG